MSMPSTRVSYELPAAHWHQKHNASSTPTCLTSQSHCTTVALQLPNTLCQLSWMQQVDWALRTVTNVSRSRDRDTSGRYGTAGGWQGPPTTKFVLTCYLTDLKTQKEVYIIFPAICYNIYPISHLHNMKSNIYNILNIYYDITQSYI